MDKYQISECLKTILPSAKLPDRIYFETEDDLAPPLYVVYTPDFTEYSEYSEGEHEPGGKNYQGT